MKKGNKFLLTKLLRRRLLPKIQKKRKKRNPLRRRLTFRIYRRSLVTKGSRRLKRRPLLIRKQSRETVAKHLRKKKPHHRLVNMEQTPPQKVRSIN